MIWNLFGKTASPCLTMLFIATATIVEAQDCASEANPGGTIDDTDARCATLVLIDETLALVQSEINDLPQQSGAEFVALMNREAVLEQIRFNVSDAGNDSIAVSAEVTGMPALCSTDVSPSTPATLKDFCGP